MEAIAKAARTRELADSHYGPLRDWDAPLERAIGRLPESQRNIVLLRYYGGLTCAQVARRLELPLGTVTKNLSRAYALMRESPELAATAHGECDPEDPEDDHTERTP